MTAPIRENLAAQMVALSGWHPEREGLIDPLAGSGTIVAEAWGWARGVPISRTIPAWLGRPATAPLRPDLHPQILALEDDAKIRPSLLRSLKDAGLPAECAVGADFRSFEPSRVRELITTEGGIVLTNPPYGVRIERTDDELSELYEDLRDWSFALGPGWRIGLIGLPEPIEAVFGGAPKMKKPMRNGDLRTYFYLYG
ncbi:MAG: hypothetical protein HC923_00795 [Myxococcales bacterium]|nr:hypothetical protein [Myxococcales bacterium]